jgi:tetratricopeptide (TPR) repeat protein
VQLVAIAAAAATLGGCAAKSQTLADRFITHGEAVSDFGGRMPRVSKRPVTAQPNADRIAEVSRYYPSNADVDHRDPRLKSALAALAVAPTLVNYVEVAQAYQNLGILDQAYDNLQHAAAIDTMSATANDGLARLWRDWGLPQFGLSNAHRAVYTAPRSATARHTLGTLLYALGMRQEAEKAFRDAVALDPHAWYAWQNLCTVVMAEGRTKDAIPLCQRADVERTAAPKAVTPAAVSSASSVMP